MDLDLTDPVVRAMAERNHEPDELWTIGGDLLHVVCRRCHQSWPCPTTVRLREEF